MQKQQEIVFFLGTILLTLTAANLKIAENYWFQILFIDVSDNEKVQMILELLLKTW